MSAMLSWQVGRVKITRIVELDLPLPARAFPEATPAVLRKSTWLYPHFVSEDGATLNLSVHALLVEAPGLKLVVDTCIGNDRAREITGCQALATPFLKHLSEAGWSRDGVDAVVCTHLHVDHVGWNTMLEDAEAAIRTRSRLFAEWADQPILVIGTHFAAPTAGHVVRDGAAFRFAV